MGMWTMHTKTFDTMFAKVEQPKKVLRAQYIVVSTRIRKSGTDGNVITVSKLFPNPVMLSDYRMDIDSSFFRREYEKQLDNQKHILAVLVATALDIGEPLIFICTPKEWKLGFLKIMAEYIEREFHYPVINYKKYKKHPWAVDPPDINLVFSTCESVIRKKQKAVRKEKMKTKKGRQELVDEMSKDEMSAELKRMNLYHKDLTKSEMRELLELFFVT